MSVELVKKAMHQFLTTPGAQVLCISGKWGTGKTHAWREALKEATKAPLPLSKYAYVSLFGIKDAADILQSAYVNSIDLQSLTTAKLNQVISARVGMTFDEVKLRAKKLTDVFANHATVPWVSGLGGVARAVMSNLIKDAIVCIDDIERKGQHVTITDIMGVIAQLRDSRDCKIILILNEDSLQAEDQKQFALYSEKVIDMTFKFIPTAAEAASFAFPNTDEVSELLRKATAELGVTNIRILMKIGAYAREMMGLLQDIDAEVRASVLRSLILIAWSILSPGDEGAPKLDYVLNKRHDQFFSPTRQQFTDAEVGWGALLDAYGFTGADDFDRTLVEDIQRGFFDQERLKGHIEKYLADAQKARAHSELEGVWRAARLSFSDNADQVGPAIYQKSAEHIAYLPVPSLSNTVSLLKAIGFPEEAKALLDSYMAAHGDKDIFDWRNGMFGPTADDPDVQAAFDAKQASKPAPAPRSPIEAAARILSGGWGSDDEDALRRLSVDELEVAFKTSTEEDRHTIARGALKFFSNSNAPPDQREISERAKEALIRIGNSSPLNRFRVRAMGIQVDDPASEPPGGNDQEPKK